MVDLSLFAKSREFIFDYNSDEYDGELHKRLIKQ